MDWATFTDYGLHVAAVDHETVGVRATWTAQTAQIYVPHSVLSAASTGAELFNAVFSESVGTLWRAALSSSTAAGGRVDVRLSVNGTGLEQQPWELMYDGAADLRLSASDRTTLVRVVPSTLGRGPMILTGAVRVLAVGAEQLDEAVAPLVSGGRLSLLHVTATDVPVRLRQFWLEEVHVLHLAGTDLDVRPLVADHFALRVVVLHGTDQSADDLVRSGCSAVLTIPSGLKNAAATTFFRTFYRGLSARERIDVVMSQARVAVRWNHPDERVLPALWMSHPRTALFAAPQPTAAEPTTSPPTGSIPTVQNATPPPAHDTLVPPPTSSTPPQQVHVEPPRPTASARGGSIWRSMREAAAGWLSGSRSRPSPTVRPRPTAPAGPTGARTAYPRIDIEARRTGRRDVVLVDEPFDIVVGLGRFQDVALTQTGALRIAAASRTDLELVLTFDPTSLVAHGPTRLSLSVTDADPFPSQQVRFTARYRPDLPRVRRIGVHYLRDGQVVGIAWRSFVVVLDAADIAGAPVPPPEPNPLLDLEPLVGDDLPDLVLSVCASDGPATGEFVWTAYAQSTAVAVPDGPRISRLDNEAQQFVAGMRNTVAYSTDPYAEYLTLVGKATKLGRAIPESVVTMVRGVVEDPARREAATVLLLTEELSLPWELSVFDPPLDTVFGGVSPFLGAHAAVSRWPLTSRRPRPSPRSRVTVRRAAVLTADYAGVVGVAALDHAQAEARQVAALFAPPAVTVPPSLRDVVGMLRGVPPADVLHIALHGRFDAIGSDEGLVLVSAETDGSPVRTALFLTPDQVETGRLDGGPFVFLNACQVASDKRVLADYAGFASTLLRIGATGVVAPLWNVDDDVAATFAQDFYAATWSGPGGSATVAEAVRVQRARYTEAAAEAHTAGITPTLIAFQVFGHPRLRLTHV